VTISSTSITTTGASGVGIAAIQSGAGTLSVTSGTINTSGATAIGIAAYGTGNVTVASTGITTTGAGSDGIRALSGGSVTVTSGTVTASGAGSLGIFAQGNGNVSVTSTAVTSNSTGISGVSGAGTVTITSGNVTTSGAGATGIRGQAGGAVTITSGNVTTTGANSIGINAISDANILVTTTGTTTTTGIGIRAITTAGAATVDATNVTAAGDAINITSPTASNVTVRGLVVSTGGGFAVQATGGAATVATTAAGTIRGRIDLTDNADVVNNAGTFDAIGDSLFGAGTDVFNNSGQVRSTSGAVSFTGLETFNNLATGRIDMRDGAVGDSLNVIGAYVGTAGSRLQLDVNLATTTADVLFTGAATGSTIIDANILSPPIFNLTGTLVVDAAAGTSATAFTLAGGAQNVPYIRLNLLFDGPNNNFLLQALPDQPVFETVEQAEMLTNFWYNSADAITAQLEAARDGLEPAGTVHANHLTGSGRFNGWVQVVGGNVDREASQSFVGGGATTVFDTSYEQDYIGVQAGLDYQAGGTILGLSFGYGKSEAEFDASFNNVEMDGYNLAAYAAFHAESGFFFNALAKVDWVDVDATPGANLLAEFDATAWGLRGVAGYRFRSGNVFFEPAVSLTWVNVDIDDYTVAGAAVSFDDIESFRGSIGLRVGGEFRSASGGTWSPFVGIYAVEEFSGDNSATFTLGPSLTLTQDAPGTYGEITAGLNYSTGRLEAFARGELDFGGERDGIGGRAGIRLRF